MNKLDTKRIARALESIAKSLNIIAEDTKVNRELRQEQVKMFNELEEKINDLIEDPFSLNKVSDRKVYEDAKKGKEKSKEDAL
ncbi:hypothetical protein A5844_002098 [Enterococcus sp. 10A9_DIV0425]|uniref:Uncharacterized protein n=1 Tax=Candidatus Enterococcus wittei TaxID=1987383 RepID=A0A242JYK2_9ENTE|nr:hypothetical protein [Enterococcus sp. 10A9_DIV0425]OTP10398.1 hypothetical protein A5844_002098 [Enterococcus sp. 10A9_DIV0425]